MSDALKIAAAFHETLTSPDKEDWTVIPDGDRVHIVAFQEETVGTKKRVFRAVFEPPMEALKTMFDKPADRLGCVTVMILSDHETNGTADLLVLLNNAAKRWNFSLTSMAVPGAVDTAAAVRNLRAQLNEKN